MTQSASDGDGERDGINGNAVNNGDVDYAYEMSPSQYAHYSSSYNVAPISTSNNSFTELPRRTSGDVGDAGSGTASPGDDQHQSDHDGEVDPDASPSLAPHTNANTTKKSRKSGGGGGGGHKRKVRASTTRRSSLDEETGAFGGG